MKKRGLALILGISILAGSINLYTFDVWNIADKTYALLKNDRAMAEDLASMTGKSADSMMQLKSTTGGWNDVVSYLENSDEAERLSDEQLQQLIEVNEFDKNDVLEAEMLARQVVFNLEEILRSDLSVESLTEIIISENSDEKNIEEYRKIGQAFDKNLAVYYMLKLKDKLGSIQAVIDEYLYCLQIEVDLSLLITDEVAYEKAVLEKGAQLMRENAITVDDISTRMFETLQPKNAGDISKANSDSLITNAVEAVITPESNVPQDLRPPDPTKEIMDEIEAINNTWNIIGG